MRTVKLATNCFVPSGNILFCCECRGKSVTDKIRNLKQQNKVYDYTFGRKTASVIFLKDDEGVILSPVTVETINARCENDAKIKRKD